MRAKPVLTAAAALAAISSAHAAITSWGSSATANTDDFVYNSDVYSGITIHSAQISNVTTPGVNFDDGAWNQYTYDGIGYSQGGAYLSTFFGANSSTHVNVFGLARAESSAVQATPTHEYYYSQGAAKETVNFTLDSLGVVTFSLINPYSYAAGDAGSQLVLVLDGTYYTSGATTTIGAGSHSVYVYEYCSSYAGNYGGFEFFGDSGYGYGGADYNFDITSSSGVVPEPFSLLSLAAGVGALLRKRRKHGQSNR